ncbi:uncharacterized membrane protein YcaP (DUF421 family) [Cytobacillus oceanisediminis]|jgi:uncharacterized membrane protein YcaP (DUF421 family)|uniref:Uncharacterized membrane protein YcaP (DUF421 family) n=1 Tax=Cytobacillus oceanisediminis TaxID=665099 RepID=A0A2V3A5B1_9BACI|nr:YetF domain-containing protein [Cytobacillus oceanisediminis]PWW31060.1 uncharacterized membrane protein YcaP (DUF421 family) [Cytobacillus oceanisediminis]
MDFFQGQQTLTAMEWGLRAVVAYFFLVIVARILGQRAISQLRLLDFVMALVIGNIIAHPLSDEELGLKGSVVTTTVLVVLYLASLFSILKWPAIRRLVNNKAITVVQNGEIIYKGLNKARISIDVLLEEFREKKVDDVKKVALALWEANGNISFFLDPKYEPITPASLQMNAEPFDMPRTIIKEGKVDKKELKNIQKDESWLVSHLEGLYQTEIKNVLLATMDGKGNLKVFLYN